MTKSNNKKREALGMNHATASNQLKKRIMFALLRQTDKDTCHQCSESIRTVEELSVEHVIPWLGTDDPKKLFFDLNNIAFSHLSCNSRASRSKI